MTSRRPVNSKTQPQTAAFNLEDEIREQYRIERESSEIRIAPTEVGKVVAIFLAFYAMVLALS